MNNLFLVFGALLFLQGCTVTVDPDPYLNDSNPRYYEDWSCDDLNNELGYVLARLKNRGHQIQNKEGENLALSATGLVVFPPALLFVQVVQSADDHDYSMLMKNANAITYAANINACDGIPVVNFKETH